MKQLSDFSHRPTKILVDLRRLESNFQAIQKHVADTSVMAVVKANAYGHGLLECAQRLEHVGAKYFGVALLEEGELLRNSGIQSPIHVFGGILGHQIERFLQADLEITASSEAKLAAIDEVASKLNVCAKVHLKIDTGMGRIGVRPESSKALIEAGAKLKNVKVKGIFSHFACADEIDLSFTQQQFEAFCPILEYGKNELGSQVLGHISNSAAICQFPQANFDMVRAGLSLYGISSATHLDNSLAVEPVMSVQSQIVFFKVVKAGASVSYGRSWKASKDTRVVTVPVGYGDGYLRALSNKASVLIGAKKYPVIGRVCMDQMMVELGDGEAFNGDMVTIIGKDGAQSIRVEELAELADTVPHEILSMLNLRLPREFIG